MATLSPPKCVEPIQRPRTAPAAPVRTNSTGILRTSSSSDCANDSQNSSSTPSNITFAPLPNIEPRKRKNNRPLGVAARSSILNRQRANFAQYSYGSSEPEYQYQQSPYDMPADPSQPWPVDSPHLTEYAMQMAMAATVPEGNIPQRPPVVYGPNGEPQQFDSPQLIISISTPRTRSRKGSSTKSPSVDKNHSEWGSEEDALHELRKMGKEDGISGIKFWKRLGKRSSMSALSVVKKADAQTQDTSIVPPVPPLETDSNVKLSKRWSVKQSSPPTPPQIERRPSAIASDVISPSIVISPVEVPSSPEGERRLSRSETSTAPSSSPPTPEMLTQSVAPVEIADPADSAIVLEPLPVTTTGVEDADTPTTSVHIEGVEEKLVTSPVSQPDLIPSPLASSATL